MAADIDEIRRMLRFNTTPWNYNMFHLEPNHDYTYSYPCHTQHMEEDIEIDPVVGIYCTYNAMGYLLERYNTRSVKGVFMKDLGDYYALRILEAMHLLISQGKSEYV